MTKKKPSKHKLLNQISQKKIHINEKVRLEGLVSDLSRVSVNQAKMIRQQSNKLKMKNGKLNNERKQNVKAEEQIRISTEAMESIDDGIFIINIKKPDFPVIYANRSLQKITGHTRKKILGKNYFMVYGAGADQRVISEIKHAINKGRAFKGEMFSFQKKGVQYWTLLRIAPVRDLSGDITHYIGIQTDMTLLRQKEQKIAEQREEILHVTRVGKLAEFVSSLAHEISQPLTAILSYAQAAQRKITAGDNPELKKIIAYIIKDNQRASAVIHRLHSLLKKGEAEAKELNINSLIDETVGLIATDAAIRKDVLKIELMNNLPLIRGDHVQLQQVLLNLISNSFDALESGKEVREIKIRSLLKDADTIMVEVEDSGCGIPLPNLPKLFTRFFTSKQDGLGMGLSISRSIVEAHGGRLEVKNNPKRGATFSFTLPIDRKDKA